ncbi:hypothetical protein UFOVP35_21 [uncultured Caudovirales phage]|uniref:Uncharacterized protein n=1 Tax=uncultured Caudovirales phage TaxID=2100421 RepID=A0A6J5KQ38_9CAUD|nr:hypothetical protein UFOVP35_21 [uncultured Caudovirales phage]CAB4124458.1 hypothetical protein UFOVP52_26 [uncultured Caudovirales phage]CAB5219860.1 hypothetical protein UFOVP234_51 [uncultured Caudovirales phage]
MSSIAAGTSTGTALVSSGDTTGNLVLQVNGTTPSLTLNAAGAHGVGSSPSYGTAGQVLTSAGSGASPTWATSTSANGGTTASGSVILTSSSVGTQAITTTAYGQSVTLPSATTMTKSSSIFNINNAGSYPLKVINNAGSILGFIYPNTAVDVGLADNSTAAGVWNITGLAPTAVTAEYVNTTAASTDVGVSITRTVIDANRTLILSGSGANNLYGIIYDSSTLTWGTLTLIRTGGGNNRALLTATNQVLVVSCNSTTALEAVVLTLSGTIITVNTAATATAGGTTQFNDFVAVGTSYIIGYSRTSSTAAVQAITISGTTPTIGTALDLSGTAIGSAVNFIFSVSSSVVLTFSSNATSIIALPVSVSGTTLTAGTAANITAQATDFRAFSFGTRWCLMYLNTNNFASIVSVSGTTATASSVQINAGTVFATTTSDYFVFGSKVAIIQYPLDGNSILYFNILTDTAGTASAGTALSYLISAVTQVSANVLSGNTAVFTLVSGQGTLKYNINISSASPTLNSVVGIGFTSTTAGVFGTSNRLGIRSPNWVKGATNYTLTAVRTVSANLNTLQAAYTSYASGIGTVRVSGYDNESWASGSITTTAGLYLQRIEGVS